MEDVKVVERWSKLEQLRNPLEAVWKDCAKLTLPYVFPSDEHNESEEFETPYNSVGPSSVNSLASKLLLAVLPPSGAFFRLLPIEETLEGMGPEQLAEVDKALSDLEVDISEMISVQSLRVALFEAMKLLIITGNCMVYKVAGGGLKVFNPYQYVVQRDFVGNPVEIVIRERIAIAALPEDLQSTLQSKNEKNQEVGDQVDIYTYAYLHEGKWESYQEVEEEIVESTRVTYTKELMPYLPLRWTSVFNENYGRGIVEQYLGDLRSLEGLTQMILEGSGAASKIVWGLKPNSTTRLEDLQDAGNGDVILGDLEKDLTTLQLGKNQDFAIPFQLMTKLEQRLASAFLNVQSSIRDSERTTATEIRAVTAELEAALGGVFSVLAQELQLPLLRILLDEIQPEVLDLVTPSIVTGVSAISRERDFQNLNIMLQSMAQLGPDVLAQYLKVDGYLSAVATSLGLDSSTIVRSKDELASQTQAQEQPQGLAPPGTPQPV